MVIITLIILATAVASYFIGIMVGRRIPFQDRIVKDINVPIKTNADRIRAMTDEELSSWINDHANCNRRCEAWKDGCMYSDSTCRAAWLDWLKEEVKE